MRAVLRRAFALVLLCVLIPACTLETLNDFFTPDGSFVPGYGLIYGPEPRHLLDVYTPRAGKGPKPVIVFLYGGTWKWGERWQYKFAAEGFASRGYVVVVPDYRLAPSAQFPAFMEDAARAVAWTRANIAGHGGAPEQIFLAGHSAGAHIGALVALDPSYLEAAGAAGALRGFIGLSGPYSFDPTTWSETAQAFATARGQAQRAMPIRLARAGAPPMLLLHGEADRAVAAQASRDLAAAVRAAGGAAESRIYPGVGHVGMILATSSFLRWRAPVLSETDAFIARVLADNPE